MSISGKSGILNPKIMFKWKFGLRRIFKTFITIIEVKFYVWVCLKQFSFFSHGRLRCPGNRPEVGTLHTFFQRITLTKLFSTREFFAFDTLFCSKRFRFQNWSKKNRFLENVWWDNMGYRFYLGFFVIFCNCQFGKFKISFSQLNHKKSHCNFNNSNR